MREYKVYGIKEDQPFLNWGAGDEQAPRLCRFSFTLTLYHILTPLSRQRLPYRVVGLGAGKASHGQD